MRWKQRDVVEVLIDARPLRGGTGIARYTNTIIAGLPAYDRTKSYKTFGWRSQIGEHRENLPAQVTSILPGRALAAFARAGLAAPRWGIGNASIFHGTSFDIPNIRGLRTIATLYDLIFMCVPDAYPPTSIDGLVAGVRRAAKSATLVATVSHNSKADLIEYFKFDPDRVRVLYPPVVDGNGTSLYLHSDTEAHRVESEIPYLLVVGTVTPHKNLIRIIDAFALVSRHVDHQLVVVGSHENQSYSKLVKDHACSVLPEGRVKFTGMVNDQNLSSLYDGADALVMCSLYEGFGYPVAEAASRGIPVITSNVSSLPEVAGAGALLVDPRSTEEIADALHRVIVDSELRAALIQAGRTEVMRFTVERFFHSIVEMYGDLESRM